MIKIKLNPETSYIEYFKLTENKCDNNKFELLWNLHPKEYHIIKIYNKIIKTPRWQQSYGLSYKFSGTINEAQEIPEIIQEYIDYANMLEQKKADFDGNLFNMALVNWYLDGSHYISYHSDDESQLITNSSIYCFSFGQEREFLIKSNKYKNVTKILLENNSLVIMGGTCQKTHKHSIPKRTKKKCNQRRISITLRKFK